MQVLFSLFFGLGHTLQATSKVRALGLSPAILGTRWYQIRWYQIWASCLQSVLSLQESGTYKTGTSLLVMVQRSRTFPRWVLEENLRQFPLWLLFRGPVIPLDPQAHIGRNNMKQTPLVSYNVLCFVLHPVLKLYLKTDLRSRQSVATVSFHR